MTYFVRMTMLALSIFASFTVRPSPVHASESTASSTPPAATTPETHEAKAYYEQAVAGISGTLRAAKTAVEDGSARERAETASVEITQRVAQFDRDFNRMSAPQRLWILDQMIAGVKGYHGINDRGERVTVMALPAFALTMVTVMILLTAPLMGGIPKSEMNSLVRMIVTAVALGVVGTTADFVFYDQLPALLRTLEALRTSTANEVKAAELR